MGFKIDTISFFVPPPPLRHLSYSYYILFFSFTLPLLLRKLNINLSSSWHQTVVGVNESKKCPTLSFAYCITNHKKNWLMRKERERRRKKLGGGRERDKKKKIVFSAINGRLLINRNLSAQTWHVTTTPEVTDGFHSPSSSPPFTSLPLPSSILFDLLL